MKQISIFTDGSCINNPGPGGWAAVLMFGPRTKEISGKGPADTTNNRMELFAILKGIEALKEPCSIVVWSDSEWSVNVLNKVWRAKTNLDLIRLIQTIVKKAKHKIRYQWIKGHSHFPVNCRADKLASHQAHELARELNNDNRTPAHPR